MKKAIISCAAAVLVSLMTLAQGFQFDWAQAYGDTANNYSIYSPFVDIDGAGNVYLAGHFADTLDFDPGPGVFNLTPTGIDVFIVKLDASGNFIWAKATSGGIGHLAYNADIYVQESGFIYLAGTFTDSVDFDPGPGISILTGDSESDAFLLKLDLNGNFIWAQKIGGAGNATALTVSGDMDDNVCVAGKFSNVIDLDPGLGIDPVFSNGQYDVFIAKYRANGDRAWLKTVGGGFLDVANAITCDNDGNVITTGYFGYTVDFDPDTGVYNLSYVQIEPDAFVLKLDSAGNFVWARSIAGYSCMDEADEGNQGCAVKCDSEGNVYTSGFFQCTVDFDPGPGTHSVTSNGGSDIFVHKMTSSGEFSWVRTVGGQSSSQYDIFDAAYSIDLDTAGFIYASGIFDNLFVDFDPGPNVHNLNVSGGGVFIWQLDTAGNFINAIPSGGKCVKNRWQWKYLCNRNVLWAGRF